MPEESVILISEVSSFSGVVKHTNIAIWVGKITLKFVFMEVVLGVLIYKGILLYSQNNEFEHNNQRLRNFNPLRCIDAI